MGDINNSFMKTSNDKELNSKNSKEAPVYTKGMSISFGFKRKVSSAPTTKTQHISSNLDNSIYKTDKNANKFQSETTKLSKFNRQNEFGKKSLEDNKKTINRINNLSINNSPEINPDKKKHKNGGQKSVRFLAVEPKPQKNNYSSIYANKSKQNCNELTSPPPSKFTLCTSNLPKPQIPVHVTNLKSTKTVVNNNKIRVEENFKSRMNNAKEIFMMTNNVRKGSNDTIDTKPQQNVTPKQNRVGYLTRKFENHRLTDENEENEYYSLPNTSVHNSEFLSRIARPSSSDRFRKTVPQNKNESRLYQSRILSVCGMTNMNDGVRNPHNSPEKYKACKGLYSSIATYDKLPQIQPINTVYNNTRQRTFVKEEQQLFSKTFRDNNSIISAEKMVEYNWDNAGETMADDASYSLSSSDESKEKDACDIDLIDKISMPVKDDEFLRVPPSSLPLTTSDPAFAAMAKSSDIVGNLLEDESPADSLFCSLSEENGKEEAIIMMKNRISKKGSSSIEKLSPNGSNSLSLSDGKDFLIDDEIADQPALLFNHNHGVSLMAVNSNDNSVNSSPKMGRLNGNENDKAVIKRTVSLDTLSPCESLASDDLIMNFDNVDTSEYDENESTEKDVLSSRFNKTKSTNIFSPKYSNSPLTHVRVTEIKMSGSPKKTPNLNQIENQNFSSEEIIQDVSSLKETLTRLRGVLLEFETQSVIDNDCVSSENQVPKYADEIHNYKMENNDLRRQILFLQGQLEDKERALQEREEFEKVTPSSLSGTSEKSNAATQTDKARNLTSSRSFMYIGHQKEEFGSIIR